MDISDATAKVIKRAEEAGLETEVKKLRFRDSDDLVHYVLFPSGQDKRRIEISNGNRANLLLNIEFERISFLGNYEAIADLKTGEIEAIISPRENFGMAFLRERLGFGSVSVYDEDGQDEEEEHFALRAERSDGVSVEISECTDKITALKSRFRKTSDLTLKIALGREHTPSSALAALEMISNSLFFQLDTERGIALALQKVLRRRRPFRIRDTNAESPANILFPAFEYDKAPISLYWYARSARGMPLLQFLAYYQVVEYYFPNFAKLEAIRSARKILKQPNFRVDRESDITKLVAAISGSGRVGISERDQIKITVKEVLSMDDVEQFFDENEEIKKVVGKKQPSITDKTINIDRKNHDHRPDIAELLYDIRCRIVHTKNGFESPQSEMILPFSSAEENLWANTELMQFVAQNALVRSSSVLSSV